MVRRRSASILWVAPHIYIMALRYTNENYFGTSAVFFVWCGYYEMLIPVNDSKYIRGIKPFPRLNLPCLRQI